jgi:hypothetical protein
VGQSVKLVFRPEDVRLGKQGGELPADCNPLANGEVEEKHFVGAYERLTVRLDLVARRPAPGEPPLYEISETPERRLGVPVIVTRTKSETSAAPLRVGDRVTLCLTIFRVLPNFPLASERAGRVLDTSKG